MNKYQEVLDELSNNSESLDEHIRFDILQELIYKHEKLREFLVEYLNTLNSGKDWYNEGSRLLLELLINYLDKENEDA